MTAGGVDALIIGSEMRGLTFAARRGRTRFRSSTALVTLAADVRAIVGGGDEADLCGGLVGVFRAAAGRRATSSFTSIRCGRRDDIDAVGIDNYMPLADWRDGTDHADAAIADGPYDPAYLEASIAGGEGFDWYYASDADRIAGTRTPITDGAYGEPWVWRFKDIARLVGATRTTTGRAGCGRRRRRPGCRRASRSGSRSWAAAAVDKGANQPNVFGDPKSSEDGRPYFSNGAPDPLMQRQLLRAHLAHWADDGQQSGGDGRSASGSISGPGTRGHIRRFRRSSTCGATARTTPTGHWLTGRLGAHGERRAVAGDGGGLWRRRSARSMRCRRWCMGWWSRAWWRRAMRWRRWSRRRGLAVRDRPEGWRSRWRSRGWRWTMPERGGGGWAAGQRGGGPIRRRRWGRWR